VVPAGMLPRVPDMSTDMRLLAASEEAAGSEEYETVAMGLVCPLGCWGLVRAATTAAYAGLLAVAACCPLHCVFVSGGGRLAAGVVRPSEPQDLVFLFPVVGSDPFLGKDGVTLLAPLMEA
jgi:hypothetical protein